MSMLLTRLSGSRWAGIAGAALLCGAYAQGGPAWVLGFVALLPWLRTLDREDSLARTLLSAWAMSVAYTAAVFFWFGTALGAYTQLGAGAGLVLLLLAAPLFQPQILVFAVVRHLARRHHGRAWAAVAAATTWVAAEWAVPRVLGDTLGHGLYSARLLRQAAALGGATGLTLLLLLANEALTAALARRRGGWRTLAAPLGLAAVPLLLLGLYGLVALQPAATPPGPLLRLGLVQSNITDYERLRRERGAGAVVREVLDTHFAMSYDAVERHKVQAVLWSETVYPTTFGQPKSEAGAALDAEIAAIVTAAGVPFVFGTYDRDAAGEYNAAAFVEPRTGLLGLYRKTRLFPYTERLPAGLDTPAVRAALPGAGAWQPGSGARVYPLRLADGRELPVQPLICLDDTDPELAIAGARLGAQALLTMSNDSWFTDHAQGAALHQAVAAFRSIETGLPQFRVTTNGYSAAIAPNGDLLATTRMGERTLVIAEAPVGDVVPTLMVRWGDWVGRAAALALVGGVLLSLAWRLASTAAAPAPAAGLPQRLAVLPPAVRWAAALLRAISRTGMLGLGALALLGDGTLTGNTLALIRSFTALCLLPELLAWGLLRACTARVTLADGQLQLSRGRQQLVLPLDTLAAVRPWRLPLPAAGATLRLASGEAWPWQLATPDPWALAAALGQPVLAPALDAAARSRAQVPRGRLARPLFKHGLLPLALAVPAFHLHQNIAYGSPLGELYSFGLTAYLSAFALWWAAWAIGVVLCSAWLRTAIEAVSLAGAWLRPATAMTQRVVLERMAVLLLYAGPPVWLALRVWGS